MLTPAQRPHRLLIDFGIGRIGLLTDVPGPVRTHFGMLAPGCPVIETAAETPTDTPTDTPNPISLHSIQGGYRVRGPVHDVTEPGLDIAVLWAFSAALEACCRSIERAFVLNAGAFCANGRATVFAGASHAGKSSVALHLAAAGLPLLGDDRLLITDDVGGLAGVLNVRSTGLSRKVRLPLPDDFAQPAKDLAQTQQIGRITDAAILRLDSALDRPAGTGAPLYRIVLVERGAESHRRLNPAEAAVAVLPLVGCHAGNEADLVGWIVNLTRRVRVDSLSAPTSAGFAAKLLADSEMTSDR